MLLVLAMPSIAFPFNRDAGLILGDESYELGRVWWLIFPLAVLSIVAVFRLAYGHRDWVAPILSAIWLGLAIAFAIETGQYGFLALTAVITLLLTSGIWADRRGSGRGDRGAIADVD